LGTVARFMAAQDHRAARPTAGPFIRRRLS
jgi:hypothetical protein